VRSHLVTTALQLHHVNITSNHRYITIITHSKYWASLLWSSCAFSVQLTHRCWRSNYLDQLIKEDPESVRRSHSLGIRYAWSFYWSWGRNVRAAPQADWQVSGETLFLHIAMATTKPMATFERRDMCSWDYIWPRERRSAEWNRGFNRIEYRCINLQPILPYAIQEKKKNACSQVSD
jgi:hypothetical protein